MRMVKHRKYSKYYLSSGGFGSRDFELFEYIAIFDMFGFLGKICYGDLIRGHFACIEFTILTSDSSGRASVEFLLDCLNFPAFRRANYSPHWRMNALNCP
jgi:hypothetical protein